MSLPVSGLDCPQNKQLTPFTSPMLYHSHSNDRSQGGTEGLKISVLCPEGSDWAC